MCCCSGKLACTRQRKHEFVPKQQLAVDARREREREEVSCAMNSVPPRRGQRVKSRILPPFNGGAAFSLVRVETAERKDSATLGVVHKRGAQQSSVWLEFDLIPTVVDTARLTSLEIPRAPELAYEEHAAVIGGIGKHVRWNVVFPNKKFVGLAHLRVGGVEDRNRFCTFVNQVLCPFGLCHFEFEGTETTVDVPDVSNLGTVAAALHCAGYTAVPTSFSYVSGSKLAPERYDRSEHMWWNQEQSRAGPLRDVDRWSFDFLPPSWKHIPFTWQSLCCNIDIDPLTESKHLPLPLRDFYLTMHIDALNGMRKQSAEEARDGGEGVRGEVDASFVAKVDALKRLRGRPSVTCRLSQPQNQQLLHASYWNLLAPFEEETVKLSRLLRFRYMLHGYTVREIGGYRQTASNLGHGAQIRCFRNKPQYLRENLSVPVLNRIYREDGSLAGSGFKGTRGKYGHKDFPKYVPCKRMKRTVVQERKIRQSLPNLFAQYRQRVASREQGLATQELQCEEQEPERDQQMEHATSSNHSCGVTDVNTATDCAAVLRRFASAKVKLQDGDALFSMRPVERCVVYCDVS